MFNKGSWAYEVQNFDFGPKKDLRAGKLLRELQLAGRGMMMTMMMWGSTGPQSVGEWC